MMSLFAVINVHYYSNSNFCFILFHLYVTRNRHFIIKRAGKKDVCGVANARVWGRIRLQAAGGIEDLGGGTLQFFNKISEFFSIFRLKFLL